MRDLAGNKTLLVSRADGEAGAAKQRGLGNRTGATTVSWSSSTAFRPTSIPMTPTPAGAFSFATLVSGSTVLASRRPGLTGANATGTQSSPDISGNGRFVAWRSGDPDTALRGQPVAHRHQPGRAEKPQQRREQPDQPRSQQRAAR